MRRYDTKASNIPLHDYYVATPRKMWVEKQALFSLFKACFSLDNKRSSILMILMNHEQLL